MPLQPLVFVECGDLLILKTASSPLKCLWLSRLWRGLQSLDRIVPRD
jgi:hypothetical protein